MKYRRKDGNIEFTSNEPVYSLYRYLERIIGILSADMSKDTKLTKRELQCMVACCIIANSEDSYIYTPQALEIFSNLNFKDKKTIKTWVDKVVGKEWINLSPNDNIVIPEYLANINLEGDVCDFKIRVIYETNGSNLD